MIRIHNDVVIYGTSDQDNDANLINLINVAQLKGLVLNSKLELKSHRVTNFIGMVTYMGNFIQYLSHHTKPQRAMLKQDALFHWDKMPNSSFQKITD